MDAFEVGRNTAVTPGKVVFQNDLIQLIQYAPATEQVYAKPLLIMPPWINKFYILDLNARKSMVKWLTEQGYTVFVVSWVNPDERHGGKTWEHYMFEGGLTAIDKVLEETGEKSLNLVSYCVGGTMAGTLMAWLGKHNDKRVASATFFTAQLDFQDAGELQIFVDEHILEVIGEDMEKGYMPADRMANAFNMLRANDLIWGYMVSNYMLGRCLPLRPALLERRFRRRCRRGRTASISRSSTSGTPSRRASSRSTACRSPSATSRGRSSTSRPRRTTSPRRPRSIAAPRR